MTIISYQSELFQYSNPYSIKVAGCDDELLLNGFGEILLNYINRYNK